MVTRRSLSTSPVNSAGAATCANFGPIKTTSFLLEDALRARSNRDEAYKQAFKLLKRNAIPGVINHRRLKLYWNINLYIDITSTCNCSCPFCINCVTFDRSETDDEQYLAKLERAIVAIRRLEPSVQIVGGEPTLPKVRRRLLGIMELAKYYNLRKTVIGTNGSGFTDVAFAERIAPCFSHINISRHHYDETKLHRVWRFRNPLTNEHLRELIHSGFADKIRLNCCLLKGYIDSFEEVDCFVSWAMEMGVRNIAFATLSTLPAGYIYPDSYLHLVNELQIDLESIMAAVSNDPSYSFLKFHSGTHCMYEVWEKIAGDRTCTIVFATSNNLYARQLDLATDLIELLVFHTDGTLAASWNRNAKQLLAQAPEAKAGV